MDQFVAGIDGCRAGWIVCKLPISKDAQLKPIFEVKASLKEVWDSLEDAELILIDIPIGLAEKGDQACDRAAKKRLSGYHPRVFMTPPRGVLDCESREAGCLVSERLCGRRITVQSWNILPKIREVDAFLQDHSAARERIRECHPEICFLGLAGEVVGEKKKSQAGYERRIEILEQHLPHAGTFAEAERIKLPRAVAARDDIVDAMVAAVTAREIALDANTLCTLPDEPESDATGLPMEIVYAARLQDRGS